MFFMRSLSIFHSILSKNHCIFFNKFNLDFVQRTMHTCVMCGITMSDDGEKIVLFVYGIPIYAYYIYIYKGKCPLIIINVAEPLDTKKSSYRCSYHGNLKKTKFKLTCIYN